MVLQPPVPANIAVLQKRLQQSVPIRDGDQLLLEIVPEIVAAMGAGADQPQPPQHRPIARQQTVEVAEPQRRFKLGNRVGQQQIQHEGLGALHDLRGTGERLVKKIRFSFDRSLSVGIVSSRSDPWAEVAVPSPNRLLRTIFDNLIMLFAPQHR